MMKLTKDKYSGRTRLGENISKALTNAKRTVLVKYPQKRVEIFNTNKKINTYEAKDVRCVPHCIHHKTCFRRKHPQRKNLVCADFVGERFNFQVCTDCKNVRIVEYPKRIWGLCPACEKKRELRKEQFGKKKEGRPIIKGMTEIAKKRDEYVRELMKEWENV